jgi:hypothetical protein
MDPDRRLFNNVYVMFSFLSDGSPAMRSTDRNRRWAAGAGMAVGAAFAAALIGLANAPAASAVPSDDDPFQDLFGFTASGVNSWTQGADVFLHANAPALATGLDQFVDSYLAVDQDPLTDLVQAIDPSAFIGNSGMPATFVGELAIAMDSYVLFPTGLGAVLDPTVDAFFASM